MHTYKKSGQKRSLNGLVPTKNGKSSIVEASLKKVPWDAYVPKTEEKQTEPATAVEAAPAKKKRKRKYEETGNAINVEHFNVLMQVINGLGTVYVSPNPLYGVENMEAVYREAIRAMYTVSGALTDNQQAIDVQTVAFKPLKGDSTRSKNVFAICGAPMEAVVRCKHINDEIQGNRIIKINASVEDKDIISASHQSYTRQIQHVDAYVDLFTAYPEYVAPTDLTVEAWRNRRTAMYDAQSEVTVTGVTLKMARLNRNEVLQAPETGLVDVAYGVKKVVLGIFGARSPQYRMVSGISFKRLPGYKDL